LAVLDLAAEKITRLIGLGFKDHSQPGNGLDASDRDGNIQIQTYPLHGMYQPDGIAAFLADGHPYLILANEGDARSYAGYDEEARIADL
jgi:hypothetical protein